MPPPHFQKDKAEQKKCHNRSLRENFLLNLNFNDNELQPQNLDKEYNEIMEITAENYSTSVSNTNLTEENILTSLDTNVTQLIFDITKDQNEYRAFLTGVTNDLRGSSFAIPKKIFHCANCSQRDLTVTFAPGYNETMDSTEPYVPLNVTVTRAFIIMGCQKKTIIDCLASQDDSPLVVCRTDSAEGKFIVAPSSINTHSLSFFMKFNGSKKINHAFDVTKVDKDLYRKYLILMTLTNESSMQKYCGSFLSYTLFPFSSMRHNDAGMLSEDEDM